MALLSILASLFAIGFATESVGLFAHELNLSLAILCLIVGATTDRGTRRGDSPTDRKAFAIGAGFCLVGLLLLPEARAVRLFSLTAWFWGLSQVARSRGSDGGLPAASLAIACFVGGLLNFAYAESLLAWYGVRDVSVALAGLTATMSGSEVTPGPTFNGLLLAAVGVATCLGAGLLGRSRRGLALLALVGVGLAYVIFLFTFAKLSNVIPTDAEFVANKKATPLEACGLWLFPVRAGLLLPLLLAIPLSAIAWINPHRPKPRPTSKLILAALLASSLLAAWAFTNYPAPLRTPRNGPMKVTFFEKGFHNWMVPQHERYGSRSGGMFGNLPLMVERMGWNAEKIPDITPDALASTDIFVIMNQKEPLPEESLAAIDAFVEGGGSLLILGDHTFYKSREDPVFAPEKFYINGPIRTTNMAFEFDTAYYFIGGWLHSIAYGPHQTVAHLGDDTNAAGCVAGASLDIEYPAAPLIVGRYGWSDPGVPDQPRRGYMGNSRYDPNEPLGDLVLVAAENVGKGRVVVVGDTSGFVNLIMAQTWPFTHRVFHWLGSDGSAAIPKWRDLLGLALLVLMMGLILSRARSDGMGIPFAALMLLLGGLASQRFVATRNAPAPLSGKVAIVDLSHVGYHSIEGWRDNGIAGVYLNLMRKGYFVLGSPTFDENQIRSADLFVSVVPTKPYSPGEVTVLQEFMQAGGTVMLAADWQYQAGAKELLDRFDLSFDARPQGRGSVAVPGTNVAPQFWTAWPITGGDPMVEMRSDPVIARKRIGQGQLIVIGDAGFLVNRNLETEDGGIMPNISAFDWLLEQAAAKGGS